MIFLSIDVFKIVTFLLGKNAFYHVAMHIGEAVITTLKAIGKLGVINPH
jgi:hypothetical protein